jgi:hypothetical protein
LYHASMILTPPPILPNSPLLPPFPPSLSFANSIGLRDETSMHALHVQNSSPTTNTTAKAWFGEREEYCDSKMGRSSAVTVVLTMT